MSIVGGAIFPYLMGTVIDLYKDSVQAGYIVPLGCFVVIVYFAIDGYKKQHAVKPHLSDKRRKAVA
ncbi:MAG TPA: hypothetical protein VLJ41_02975 [Segetibacter sp.]|nr:hypothetical protein [Segetibacter sp.]